ncbi:hypothetical protein BGZ76_000595 [Entomortierella beljakovae]|nr:hypothetical protein BGZ76_000595 [Entomortierella beljakovae]
MPATHANLQGEFNGLRTQSERNREEQRQKLQDDKVNNKATGDELRRHSRWQTFNRYRNIGTSARQKPGISSVVNLAQSERKVEADNFRHRRYFIKKRTRPKQDELPLAMKQYKWKPFKKAPDNLS